MALKNRTFTEFIVDQWSYFSHKISWRQPSNAKVYEHPTWVPPQDARRIRSYAMLEAYFRNVSRFWMDGQAPLNVIQDRREYGDVTLLVNQVMQSVIGSNQQIKVEGVIEAEPAPNTDPTNPDPGPPTPPVDNPAKILQEALEKWVVDDNFGMKFIESERQAQRLGDSVYVIYYDPKKQRPCCNVYDPACYFPVFNQEAEYGQEDFPRKVNLAWEFEDYAPLGGVVRKVRRLQWYLAPYEGTDVDKCFYSDGIWEVEGIGADPDLFMDSRAKWITEGADGGHIVDLDIDFIPVIHLPNDVALQNHFGTALVSHVLQLVDDIIANDTDLQKAGSLAGSPPIAVEGQTITTDASGSVTRYGPGEIMDLGGGKATVIDTSAGLKALLELKDALLERLSVNIRIPEALLGRVKPNEVPSGIAITLSFTPHIGLVREMRMVRDSKYPILFKFVARFMEKYGYEGVTEVLPISWVLGSFLPADKQETMTMVVQLYGAKLISLETAVQMLIDSGVPIYSIMEEIQRIEGRDIAAAQSIANMGNLNEGRQKLGLPALTPDQQDQFGDPNNQGGN